MNESIHNQPDLNTNINLDCLICLELLCEPVTIYCGHSFCKFCLISYLKSSNKCPICRKVVLLSNRESLSKNVILSQLAEAKNPSLYDERKRSHLISLNNIPDEEISCLYVYFQNCIVLPNQILTIQTCDLSQENTLYDSFYNQQPLVISHEEGEYCKERISSLCKVIEYRKEGTLISLTLLGIKRFHIKSYSISNEVSTCYGVSVKDELVLENEYEERIDEEEKEMRKAELEELIKKEIYSKALYIIEKLNELMINSSLSIQNRITRIIDFSTIKLDKLKDVYSDKNNIKFIDFFENFSFLLLSNMNISYEDRLSSFKCKNLYRKIDNIYMIFKEYDKNRLFSNPIFALELFGKGSFHKSTTLLSNRTVLVMLVFVIALIVLFRFGYF